MSSLAVAPSSRTHEEGRGEKASAFKATRMSDRSRREAMNRQLGLAGEQLVVRYEKEQLTQAGRPGLAEQLRHVAVVEGNGAGYDIFSFDTSGEPKYIEVKTTTGPQEGDFFVSAGEVAFSARNAER
jgi:hypothetical protein